MLPIARHPELKRWIDELLEQQATTPGDEQLETIHRYWSIRSKGDALPDKQIAQLCREADVPAAAMDWLSHLGWLSGLLDAGCTFSLDDCTPEEWDGLGLWRAAEARLRSKYVACPKCGAGIAPDAKQHQCGWARETS